MANLPPLTWRDGQLARFIEAIMDALDRKRWLENADLVRERLFGVAEMIQETPGQRLAAIADNDALLDETRLVMTDWIEEHCGGEEYVGHALRILRWDGHWSTDYDGVLVWHFSIPRRETASHIRDAQYLVNMTDVRWAEMFPLPRRDEDADQSQEP